MHTRQIVRLVTTLVAAVLGLALVAGPAAAHQESVAQLMGGPLDLDLPLSDSVSVRQGGSGGGRPSIQGEPAGPADRVTPPAALTTPLFSSATARVGDTASPMLFPDEALPWRFHVDRALAQRFGTQTIIDAVGQWDGIAGSRWATAFAGETDQAGSQVDGVSTIFEKHDCPAGVGGYAYWQTPGAAVDGRYGTTAVYITEVDVAICAGVREGRALQEVLAHEIGHAVGLDHLCDPGTDCYAPEMGQGPFSCRVMYNAGSHCPKSVTAIEQVGAVHAYPTLQRLAGPSRLETAARASYAAFPTGSAGNVVIARADQAAHGPLAAAALAGRLDAPLLLGTPSEDCVAGTTASELARVAAPTARAVLVGSWPASCDSELASWGLTVVHVDGADPVALSVAVADEAARTSQGATAVLVSARADEHGHVPDGVAGGAAAATLDAPVLYTAPEQLSPEVTEWLRAHPEVTRVLVLGGPAAIGDGALADLAALGRDAIRVAGPTRVHTALALASRGDVFPATQQVVVASAASWADAVTGSAIGGRLGAPVLVTPPQPDAGVTAWLAARQPAEGYLLGGRAVMPYELQWAYGPLVG